MKTRTLLTLAALLLAPLAVLFAADVLTPRPNILFIIADDASPHFGAYRCTWVKTPKIDRLARGGLVFDNAYAPTAKCAPSRSAILTGRNPWQLEDAANHQSQFPVKFKAFSEALGEAGIRRKRSSANSASRTASGRCRLANARRPNSSI